MDFHIATRQDIRRCIGHRMVCGFDGTTLSADLKEILREVQPLGVILFARNIESLEQICELNRELKRWRAHDPLVCSVDQEGGRVARIREPATVWPPMGHLGALHDATLVRQVGAALAQELRALNFDLNYAPVLDVATRADNPVIGDRAFAASPATVATLGKAFIQGLQGGGVSGCAKHFPGHGDTDKDSHFELPFVDHDLARLRAVEWPPFRAAVEAGVGTMMTAHVMVTHLDETRPATLSARILTYLRAELGFNGPIFSDDVEMKALAEHTSLADIARQGLAAGIDVYLACQKPEVILELYRQLNRAVEEGVISHEAMLESEKRTLAWRDRFYQPPTAWSPTTRALIGRHAHGALADSIAARLRDASTQNGARMS